MPQALPLAMTTRALGFALVAGWLVGCVPPLYEQPPPDQPHAFAKVRVINHAAPGPSLNELMQLNRRRVALQPPVGDYTVPRATSLRIRVEPAMWKMYTSFYHTYSTSSTQTHSYACGKSTCTSTQTVTQTHTVVDGECTSGLVFQPLDQRTYVLQYDFYMHGQCRLQCFEQVPVADGTFRLVPCSSRPIVDN